MGQTLRHSAYDSDVQGSADTTLYKDEIRARIEETGVVPALRGASAENALYVADSLAEAGVPILEIATNRPETLDAISYVAKRSPKTILGAGSITSLAMARRCLDAGAKFLTSDALMLDIAEFAARKKIAFLPGAFTPTEVVAAWNAGADFVKVVPCDAAGGAQYIRSLKAALPDVPVIAAGGVTQQTAFDLIAAGATCLGIGRDLIPADAVRLRQTARIQELVRRFLNFVDSGRIEAAGRNSQLS
jgi:2-dehydro-3-deoxyphosphogluconate aldolase / (4S)-4-hydroxy-2-oxoglutarate aldolase